jgi:hypothetical protein
MSIPLQIIFRNMDHSASVESLAHQKADALERFSGRVTGCHLTVEALPHPPGTAARRFQASLTASMPGCTLVVSHGGNAQDPEVDCLSAVRHVFESLRRAVTEQSRLWHEHASSRQGEGSRP